MRSPSMFKWIRFWVAERAAALGLLIAAPILLVAFGAALYLGLPQGPSEQLRGVVVRFGWAETDSGSYPRAVVRLANTDVSIDLPRAHRCVIGAPIMVRRSRVALGYSYTARDCDVR
jgi:hypothetical protein